MRRGERKAWREIAEASQRVADSTTYAQEYVAKAALRSAWARLNVIPYVVGIPRSGARSA